MTSRPQPLRPGEWTRNRAWSDIVTWLRHTWPMPAGMAVVMGMWLVINHNTGSSHYLRGLLDGAVIVFALGSAVIATLVGSRTWGMMLGVSAEGFTAKELTRRPLVQNGWQTFHGLKLTEEIDHIAVGPGGVLAVETKWAGCEYRREGDTIVAVGRDPIEQARDGARRLEHLLRGAFSEEVPVHPVLIFWGPGSPQLGTDHERIGGVEVFNLGNTTSEFRRWLDEDRLAPAVAAEVQRVVENLAMRQAPVLHPTRRSWHRPMGGGFTRLS